MVSIESGFDFYINEFASASSAMFNHAKREGSRGFFFCYFKSISEFMNSTKMPLMFIKRDKRTKEFDPKLDEMLQHYDPKKQFVLHLLLKRDTENTIFKTAILHKDADKLIGETGAVLHEEETDIRNMFKD